ncbi:glycoside hydrolase family 32 protein [Paenibacillus shenyangensis]|uniref:glycoside hydrolase family 32 protein n=1 Tax=Paenibacillus sp. A9 TaxID=1284352 RepID=UPI00036D7810|nr:glycoside hydrolase family 32 protein [Paenibacillus sp. A9]
MESSFLKSYRPHLHFAPQQNWINDPNGLVYFEGEYHLFYQHHPHSTVWGPMHWGHAVSTDLIHWEELDIALYPDEQGTIFSGSAVIDWNNTSGLFPDEPGMVAIYTTHLDTADSPDIDAPYVQSQCIAYSHDRGRTWTKYEHNPVLSSTDKPDFRDPKVFWYRPKGYWVMALATGQSISFYTSSNLLDWKLVSEFGAGIGCHEGVWECPDLFRLPVEGTEASKWVLLVSIGDSPELYHGSRTQYFTGSFDGRQFMPDHSKIQWLDYGRDNYAGVSFSDIPQSDGRRIYMAWMNNWRYAHQLPTGNWRGSMTLPRVLSLRSIKDKMVLCQRPVAELDRSFTSKTKLRSLSITDGQTYEVDLPASIADINLHLQHDGIEEFGVVIHHTADQQTSVSYNSSSELLSVKRESSEDSEYAPMFNRPQQIHIPSSSHFGLRIVLDASSVEVFVNDGLYSITSLIFPDKTCERISIYTRGGDIRLYDSYIAAAP